MSEASIAQERRVDPLDAASAAIGLLLLTVFRSPPVFVVPAVACGYDTAGRLTDEATGGLAVGFGLDSAGDRVRVSWPGGFYASYVYGAMNRVTAVNENGATSGVGMLASYA